MVRRERDEMYPKIGTPSRSRNRAESRNALRVLTLPKECQARGGEWVAAKGEAIRCGY